MRTFFYSIIYLIFPILFFLLFWWGSIPFVRGEGVWRFALIGMLFGILLDLAFIRKRIQNVYNIRYPLLIAVYLFYSVCVFGFFMGVPIFNLLLGPLAGFYIGQRIKINGLPGIEAAILIRKTAYFTGGIMFLICFTSGVIALLSPSTPRDLEGMFMRTFTVTWNTVIAVILLGGAALIVGTYLTTRIAADYIQKKHQLAESR